MKTLNHNEEVLFCGDKEWRSRSKRLYGIMNTEAAFRLYQSRDWRQTILAVVGNPKKPDAFFDVLRNHLVMVDDVNRTYLNVALTESSSGQLFLNHVHYSEFWRNTEAIVAINGFSFHEDGTVFFGREDRGLQRTMVKAREKMDIRDLYFEKPAFGIYREFIKKVSQSITPELMAKIRSLANSPQKEILDDPERHWPVSIFYEVKRPQPLTEKERQEICRILECYAVEKDIEEYLRSGQGLNWESFSFDPEPYKANTILKGSTKLPNNLSNASNVGAEHWCAALTDLRSAIVNAEWFVEIEEYPIPWDPTISAFDRWKRS